MLDEELDQGLRLRARLPRSLLEHEPKSKGPLRESVVSRPCNRASWNLRRFELLFGGMEPSAPRKLQLMALQRGKSRPIERRWRRGSLIFSLQRTLVHRGLRAFRCLILKDAVLGKAHALLSGRAGKFGFRNAEEDQI